MQFFQGIWELELNLQGHFYEVIYYIPYFLVHVWRVYNVISPTDNINNLFLWSFFFDH
jgi:hypothetical protein